MNLDTIKIGLVGNPKVGKTALAQLYVSGGSTYGHDYYMVH